MEYLSLFGNSRTISDARVLEALSKFQEKIADSNYNANLIVRFINSDGIPKLIEMARKQIKRDKRVLNMFYNIIVSFTQSKSPTVIDLLSKETYLLKTMIRNYEFCYQDWNKARCLQALTIIAMHKSNNDVLVALHCMCFRLYVYFLFFK